MPEIMAVALQSMQVDMARVDNVAMNMANMATPGYRSQLATVPAFSNYMTAASAVDHAVNSPQSTDGMLRLSLDTHLGMMKMTSQPLDVALAAEGYFEVATDSGPAYTRQGNFQIDAKGRLVTAQGYPVLGRGGEIYLSTARPTIDVAGNIIENGSNVGQIKVVQFDNPKALKKIGNGMVAGGTGMTILNDVQTQIKQGYLEGSNVNSMREMTQLMQTMRHFETMQKVTQSYDAVLGSAIQKLGDM